MSRTKGARNVRTIVHEVAREQVAARNGEADRKISVAEAVLLQIRHLAMKGNIAADKALDKLRVRNNMEPQEHAGILLVPKPLATAEWIRQAEIANRFREKPEMPPGNAQDGAPGSGNPVDQPVQKPSRNGSPGKRRPGPDMRGRIFR